MTEHMRDDPFDEVVAHMAQCDLTPTLLISRIITARTGLYNLAHDIIGPHVNHGPYEQIELYHVEDGQIQHRSFFGQTQDGFTYFEVPGCVDGERYSGKLRLANPKQSELEDYITLIAMAASFDDGLRAAQRGNAQVGIKI